MKKLVVLDFEVYPNYTLFAFKNLSSKEITTVEIKGETNSLDAKQRTELKNTIYENVTFGFNSNNYDIPILLYALKGASAKEICRLSNYIITSKLPNWEIANKFQLILPNEVKHFDIKAIPKGMCSLKLYGARINLKKLQDLPIKPNTILSNKQMEDIKSYCVNDLNTTIELYNSIKDLIELREVLGNKYNLNLLSKSEAQIAEAVIKSELGKLGLANKPSKLPNGTKLKCKIPDFVKFKSKKLIELLSVIKNIDFQLSPKGKVKNPKELQETIEIGNSKYTIGIGGIHSCENKQIIKPNVDQCLIDKDVTSYYPSMILNQEIYPKHLGKAFLNVFKPIVDERLQAKKEKNKNISDSLKIVLNGTYGKFGDTYSILYSPESMISITLTGQLSLLMLIENLELNDISVVSANTDGIISLLDKSQLEKFEDICFNWELETGLNLEGVEYKGLYSMNVNNYFATYTLDGNSYKGKGTFSKTSLDKNPDSNISKEAVINYLTKVKSLEETIHN